MRRISLLFLFCISTVISAEMALRARRSAGSITFKSFKLTRKTTEAPIIEEMEKEDIKEKPVTLFSFELSSTVSSLSLEEKFVNQLALYSQHKPAPSRPQRADIFSNNPWSFLPGK